MALVESDAEVVLHWNFSKFSPSREVALLERQIAFEPIALNLDADHFAPDFLAINPFHRIPVLVDEDLTGGVAGNSRLSGGEIIPHACTVHPR